MNCKRIAMCVCLLAFCLNSACANHSVKRKKEADAIRVLGEAYLAEKKYSAAYSQLMKAMELSPDDPGIYFDLGIFYFEKEKYPEAIESYRKCLDLKPDYASAWNNLGIVYMAMQDWDTAIACFNELNDNYIYATPHYPLFLTGQAYYYKKDFKQAETSFLKVLKLQPDYIYAQHWLGKTYLSQGRVSQAVEILEKLTGGSDFFPVFYYDLGRAYVRAGDYLKACSTFTALMKKDPEGPITSTVKQEIRRLKCK